MDNIARVSHVPKLATVTLMKELVNVGGLDAAVTKLVVSGANGVHGVTVADLSTCVVDFGKRKSSDVNKHRTT